MRTQIYAGIGGVLLGVLVTIFATHSGKNDSSNEVDKIKRELAASKGEIANLKLRLDAAREQSASFPHEVGVGSQTVGFDLKGADDNSASKLKQRKVELLKQRLDIFAYRIGLSPQMLANINGQVDERLQSPEGSGGLSWKSIEPQLMLQLNPEQRKRADQLKEEQQAASIEMAVHSELYRLQTTLGLSEEQKALVFDALVQIRSEAGNRRYSNSQNVALAETELRKKAFSAILSKEQMRVFEASRRSANSLGSDMGFAP